VRGALGDREEVPDVSTYKVDHNTEQGPGGGQQALSLTGFKKSRSKDQESSTTQAASARPQNGSLASSMKQGRGRYSTVKKSGRPKGRGGETGKENGGGEPAAGSARRTLTYMKLPPPRPQSQDSRRKKGCDGKDEDPPWRRNSLIRNRVRPATREKAVIY